MKIKDGFVVEKVAGSYFAVAVGERADEFNSFLKMNESGAFLFKHLTERELEREELLSLMLSEYSVDAERARADIDTFIGMLAKAGLLDE